MAEKLTLADREHPLFTENIDLWNLYLGAIKGGDNFVNDENLFSHRLEDSSDYDERLDRGYFLNFCETIPALFNVYIFKEKIGRHPDKALDVFRKNVDGKGLTISEFVNRVGFFSSVFGAMHVLIDMPSSQKEKVSKREVREDGLQPYCSLVYPQWLKDWSLDSQGNFRWVVIESTYYNDEDPATEREVEKHYKIITTKDWRIEDEDGKPAKLAEGVPNTGTNALGIVPLITLYHKDMEDDKVGESMLKDIVYINRIIMNWCSCIDEQVERHTFSQLVVPDSGALAEESETGKDPLHKIGTSSVWTFPADAGQPPQFISPDVSNIEMIWTLVIDHIKEIYRLAGLIGSSDDMYVSQSGRAAQMGFLGVNSALADKAKKYQRFENELSRLVYLQLGEDFTKYQEVSYSESYDVASLGEEIDNSMKVMKENFSPTLNKTMMKNIAGKAIPLAAPEIRDTVEQEIEAGDGIVESVAIEERKAFDKGEGNPNSNLGKTFKGKGELEKEKKQKKKKE